MIKKSFSKLILTTFLLTSFNILTMQPKEQNPQINKDKTPNNLTEEEKFLVSLFVPEKQANVKK